MVFAVASADTYHFGASNFLHLGVHLRLNQNLFWSIVWIHFKMNWIVVQISTGRRREFATILTKSSLIFFVVSPVRWNLPLSLSWVWDLFQRFGDLLVSWKVLVSIWCSPRLIRSFFSSTERFLQAMLFRVFPPCHFFRIISRLRVTSHRMKKIKTINQCLRRKKMTFLALPRFPGQELREWHVTWHFFFFNLLKNFFTLLSVLEKLHKGQELLRCRKFLQMKRGLPNLSLNLNRHILSIWLTKTKKGFVFF